MDLCSNNGKKTHSEALKAGLGNLFLAQNDWSHQRTSFSKQGFKVTERNKGPSKIQFKEVETTLKITSKSMIQYN